MPDTVFPPLAMSRRQLTLSGGAVAVAGCLDLAWGRIASAQAAPTATTPASALAAPPAASSGPELDAFMALSRFATGHQALPEGIGAALLGGLSAASAACSQQVADLNSRIKAGSFASVDAFAPSIQGDPLHAFLLQVIAGWYSGVIAPGSSAVVYTLESALMYKASIDNIPIPTFAHNGPNYWEAEPNPVAAMPNF